jgi:lipopolysaccharide/colanic/teichoic acid biosynthesis glycosyltransferase
MVKRIFDLLLSAFGIIFLIPFFIFISLAIVIDSRGGIFYTQIRVGKNNKDFKLIKFRTMRPNSDTKGLLTVGAKDNRITKTGYFLRKYKIDELPQLFNVFIGTMSFVGPRPEVRKYVDLYNSEQIKVLSIKPGITDFASIEYVNENEILGKSDNPEKTYIEEIMPHKLSLNLIYLSKKNLFTDLNIIFRTIIRIFI